MNCAQISKQRIEILFCAKRVDFSEQKTNNNVTSTLREVQVQNLSFFPARSAEKILKISHKQTNKQGKTNKQTRKQTNKQQKNKQTTTNHTNNGASGAPGGLGKQISSYTHSLSQG